MNWILAIILGWLGLCVLGALVERQPKPWVECTKMIGTLSIRGKLVISDFTPDTAIVVDCPAGEYSVTASGWCENGGPINIETLQVNLRDLHSSVATQERELVVDSGLIVLSDAAVLRDDRDGLWRATTALRHQGGTLTYWHKGENEENVALVVAPRLGDGTYLMAVRNRGEAMCVVCELVAEQDRELTRPKSPAHNS